MFGRSATCGRLWRYIDNDCDGKVDEDVVQVDENCDGYDNDCDGQVDENLTDPFEESGGVDNDICVQAVQLGTIEDDVTDYAQKVSQISPVNDVDWWYFQVNETTHFNGVFPSFKDFKVTVEIADLGYCYTLCARERGRGTIFGNQDVEDVCAEENEQRVTQGAGETFVRLSGRLRIELVVKMALPRIEGVSRESNACSPYADTIRCSPSKVRERSVVRHLHH